MKDYKFSSQQISDTEAAERDRQSEKRGRILAGLILLGIGITIVMRKSGWFVPDWLLTWKMLLIVVGFYIGIRNRFLGAGWLVPVLVGFAFLLADFYPELAIRAYVLPGLLILIGLYLIFRPKSMNFFRRNGSFEGLSSEGGQEVHHHHQLNVSALFGAVKKTVVSKSFKGGQITSIFGGSEINLSQADFSGTAVLDTAQIFGATKLIIPASWQVQPEVTAILGGVDDKRPLSYATDPDKVLILRGMCLLGGLEVTCY